ncbi:MAG TPA: DUF1611 domain-containing protein [Candidatus Marinimicrobia bacterium]|nr:DUF1611 domain-containing protein [Candidatus Neomarinimicrobiota bacterium]HIO36442.1 DUF1611 domain-containing protein [Candidatus Neomarinimicrobiota bacterium]HIO74637.1 DUF1611 domain-containing protein [Candidatus Neomarinimicrobiota bacterium]
MTVKRYAALVEGRFDFLYAKTANALLRYRPEEVVCCIDSENAGKTTNEVIKLGGDTPVVGSFEEAMDFNPDTLVVGVATQGGFLPDNMRQCVRESIESGINVICGLHAFLSEDEEFAPLADKHGVSITDLRKPPSPLPFSEGTWRTRKTPTLLTVGDDCDTGKMTAAWELKRQLEEKGKKVAFVGTGQTGILLGGFGVAVDAIVSDFEAGSIEAEIDRVGDDVDLIVVEGQGSISHMAYSGVTLGLLHGTMPDMLLMCHEPARDIDTFEHPMADFKEVMDIYVRLVQIFKPCEVMGLSLITHTESEDQAKTTIQNYSDEYGIPAVDLVRFGGDQVIDGLLSKLG